MNIIFAYNLHHADLDGDLVGSDTVRQEYLQVKCSTRASTFGAASQSNPRTKRDLRLAVPFISCKINAEILRNYQHTNEHSRGPQKLDSDLTIDSLCACRMIHVCFKFISPL